MKRVFVTFIPILVSTFLALNLTAAPMANAAVLQQVTATPTATNTPTETPTATNTPTETPTTTGTPPPATVTAPTATGTAPTATGTAPTATGTAPTATGTAPTATITTTATRTPTATTTPSALPQVILSNGFRVTFLGATFNGDGTSDWKYQVEKLANASNLDYWVLGLPLSCSRIVQGNPSSYTEVKPDSETGINGIKWDTNDSFTSGNFTVKLSGKLTTGLIRIAAKSFTAAQGLLVGPECAEDEKPRTPPAIIKIELPETRIVVENNITFVVVVFNISNRGGRAKGVFLVCNLDGDDDDDDEDDDDDDKGTKLADLKFLEGAGYVKEIKGRQVIIGVGQDNVINADGTISIELKIRLDDDDDKDKFNLKYQLEYNDSQGVQTMEQQTMDVDLSSTTATTPTVTLPRLSVNTIDVRFQARWETGGGLRIYGLPLTLPITRDDGITVQVFERARFEYHPDLAGTQFVVLLGRLGSELGYAQPPTSPPDDDDDQDWYFSATGHLIASPFRTFWATRGGLITFGYPIGAAFTNDNGLLVQYFERVRLEVHPEFAGTEYEILLGLLGEEALKLDSDDDDD